MRFQRKLILNWVTDHSGEQVDQTLIHQGFPIKKRKLEKIWTYATSLEQYEVFFIMVVVVNLQIFIQRILWYHFDQTILGQLVYAFWRLWCENLFENRCQLFNTILTAQTQFHAYISLNNYQNPTHPGTICTYIATIIYPQSRVSYKSYQQRQHTLFYIRRCHM